MLLQLDEKDAAAIFRDVFDTDRNNLVDAFEAIGCLAMLSKMAIKEKVSDSPAPGSSWKGEIGGVYHRAASTPSKP